MSHHIFLSYSRKDIATMNRVRSSFHEGNLTTWTDEKLTPGTPVWEMAIEKAIENAGCLAVVLSPDAKQSQWVRYEIGYARIQNKPIFPILAHGKEANAVPLGLTGAHWTDIRRDDYYVSEFQKLITAIYTHLGLEILATKSTHKEEPKTDKETIILNSVFISYRRSVSRYIARAVFQDLTRHGFDTFMDIESIDSGAFDAIILQQIAARYHFLVILSPGTLERFSDPDDWLRREIEYAIELNKNIVPLLIDEFSFAGADKYLTGKLSVLLKYNALNMPHEYFDQAMERLRNRFLLPRP